jgi:hypothetical protein
MHGLAFAGVCWCLVQVTISRNLSGEAALQDDSRRHCLHGNEGDWWALHLQGGTP